MIHLIICFQLNQSHYSVELAKLQVTLRNTQLQEDLLREDNAELRKQIEICVRSRAETQKNLDKLEAIHNALVSDHDRLQNLHQLLTSDYDRLKYEHSALKQKQKSDKVSEALRDTRLVGVT